MPKSDILDAMRPGVSACNVEVAAHLSVVVDTSPKKSDLLLEVTDGKDVIAERFGQACTVEDVQGRPG